MGRRVKIVRDDVVWEKLETEEEEYSEKAGLTDTLRAVGNFIHETTGQKCKDCKPEEMRPMISGGYNMVYRLIYSDGTSLAMKVPKRGVTKRPEEKILTEAGIMMFVAANYNIPVPKVHHYGTSDESPGDLGPFIIMDWIDHEEDMSGVLNDPVLPLNQRPRLDPKIAEEKLASLYRQMARILLELASKDFDGVGSLQKIKNSDEKPAAERWPGYSLQRASTMGMNQVLIHTHAPVDQVLPAGVITSQDAWYTHLANVHLAQLTNQENDIVENEDDARDKYTARFLFRKLAEEGLLSQGLAPVEKLRDKPRLKDRFKLWVPDFRPANVLLDKDLKIVGVIDWEFAHTAPWHFTFDPPWWLLLLEPESWPGGPREWIEESRPRVETFLRAMETEEKKLRRESSDKSSSTASDEQEQVPLYQRMRQSWESGTWLINHAASRTFAFDYIWWEFLDGVFFGENEGKDHRARLELLSDEQKETMDKFVEAKVKKVKTEGSQDQS